MPKPAVPGSVSDEPVIDVAEDSKVVPGTEPALTIDLAEKAEIVSSAEDQLAEKIKADYERLYGGRLEQIENRLRGSQRISERLQRENEELKTRLTSRSAPTPEAIRKEELDRLVEKGDWQTAVGTIAAEKAEQLYAQRVALEQQAHFLRQQEETLDRAKTSVIGHYPDLDPETGNADSDVSKAYAEELNKDPALLRNPYGPEIAMYRMEQTLNVATRANQDGETLRQRRVGSGNLSPSRPSTGDNKVIIDKEQKEFIDYHGIDPKLYATVQRSLAQQGGVEA